MNLFFRRFPYGVFPFMKIEKTKAETVEAFFLLCREEQRDEKEGEIPLHHAGVNFYIKKFPRTSHTHIHILSGGGGEVSPEQMAVCYCQADAPRTDLSAADLEGGKVADFFWRECEKGFNGVVFCRKNAYILLSVVDYGRSASMFSYFTCETHFLSQNGVKIFQS